MKKILPLLLLTIVLLNACVPSKQYNDLKKKNEV